jgi:transcription elongation factor GreA
MDNCSISKEAYEEFKARLAELKGVKRSAISKAIGEAASHGDLKENSAYHEAKKEQSLNESRIADLEQKLRVAKVVEKKKVASTDVTLGSKVKIKDVKTKEVLEYTLVSELEANIDENKISTTTLLGKALMYHEVNDIVEFEAPLGPMKYKIMKIS